MVGVFRSMVIQKVSFSGVRPAFGRKPLHPDIERIPWGPPPKDTFSKRCLLALSPDNEATKKTNGSFTAKWKFHLLGSFQQGCPKNIDTRRG